MFRYFLGLAAVLGLFCGLAVAEAPTPGVQQPLTSYVLDNGLQVVLAPDHAVPKVAVATIVRVGGLNEPVGRSGFAHLFEHLMFTGTEAVPKIDETFSAIGLRNNATTSEDRTTYWEEGLSSTLPVMLSVDADRMANLGHDVSQQALDLQRSVVKNEMRQNVLDRAGQAGSLALTSGLFPAPHPYSRAVIGSIPDLDAATLEDVKAFFHTYYVPNNAILVVVGDFEVEAAKAMIAETYGKVPRGADVAVPQAAPFEPTRIRVTVEDRVPAPRVLLGFTGPDEASRQDGALMIAADLLGNGEYGALRKALVNTGLAAYAGAYWDSGKLGGRLIVVAGAVDGVGAEQLEAATREAIEKFVAAPVDEADVARTRENILLGRRVAKEPFRSRALAIANWVDVHGDPSQALEDDPAVAKVTVADVKAAIAQVVRLEDASVAVVMPGGRGDYPPVLKDSSGVAEPLVAELRPRIAIPILSAGEPRDADLPVAQTGMLSNGIRLVHYQTPGAPMSYVAASVLGGSNNDPAGKEGLYELASEMAYRGAGSRDFESFSKAAKDIGGDISNRASSQRTSVVLTVPPENFDQGLELLADAVQRPRFDQDQWDLLITETMDSLARREGDLADVASRALQQVMFPVGPGEPAIDVSVASIKAVSLAEAKEVYETIFTPATMVIYSVGALSLEEMRPALEVRFGQWRNASPGVERKFHPPAVFPEDRQVFLVPEPGASQSVLYVARPAPAFGDEEQPAAIAVSNLLGGDFASRLNRVIREEKGYSYGVNSSLWANLRVGSAIAVSAPVERDKTGPALEEVFKGFASLDDAPVRADELNRTVTAYRTYIAGATETAGGLFSVLMAAADSGLSLDEDRARNEKVMNLTLAPVQAEGAELSSLKRALVVVAGDPEQVLPQLEAIGIDKVTTLPRQM